MLQESAHSHYAGILSGVYSVHYSQKSERQTILFLQGITPKGVALLLNGIPRLRHVVFDVMSDVLTYIDFNTSDQILPVFGLKTVLFHSMELLSSNHLELVTKLCPKVEWLSLDSALFYNLEGLGYLPNLSLLRFDNPLSLKSVNPSLFIQVELQIKANRPDRRGFLLCLLLAPLHPPPL